ncbi:MAG: hypothetical protein D6683_16225 [Actinomyces sp.]|nr:MAG: hypothetical protein D6683_16225 [Actinomyces sp.]
MLAVLLVCLVGAQVGLTAWGAEIGVDGGYYTDVAMHVRDGDGLVSDVSLYHAGFPRFPYPSPIYPLWPWLYGMAGRLWPILSVAHWLPFVLWVLSLLGAFLFGRSLLPGRLLGLRGVHAGHLAVLMLGTQREYSRFSTRPYTEALAFCLLTWTLWRAGRLPPRLRSGVELGLWLSLLCLTRSQMFIVPVALALSLGVAALSGPEGRRWLLPGGVALSIVAGALAIWWASIRDTVVDASPLTLLRFDQARATDVLSPLDIIKDTSGPWEFIVDRLGGVLLAWSLTDWDHSYARGFFSWHWALPAAAIVALWSLPRLRAVDWRAALRSPRALPWSFVILVALGGLASVHLPHKDGFDDWYFRRRHAVICFLAFFLCLLYLLRQPRTPGRLAGVAIVVSAIGFSVESLYWRFDHALQDPGPDPDVELAQWLGEHRGDDGQLVVALNAFKPPELAWRTTGVGYHWFYERTALVDLCRMFDVLGAELLVFNPRATRGWVFLDDRKAFRRAFRPSTDRPAGYAVYTRRAPSVPCDTSPDPAAGDGAGGVDEGQ